MTIDMRELMITQDPQLGAAVREGRHGHLLRIARVVRGWTQEEAARRVGYSTATLSRIEHGQRPLTLDMLRHLAEAYELPPGMLGLASYTVLPSAPERLADARRTHGGYAAGDSTRFLGAELVAAPDYAADAMQQPRGTRALRREQLTYHGDQPVRLSTTWVPGIIAERAPALLDGVPGEPVDTGISGIIAEATGRIATEGEDQVEACAAWPAAAQRLGRKVGVPMLRTRMWWRDHLGVIQYAETVTDRPTRYPYDMSG